VAGGEPRAEIGENAGVGVAERLAGTEDVEQAQGNGRHIVGAAIDQRRALLGEFGQGIDRREIDRLAFVGRNGLENRAVRSAQRPVASAHLGVAATRIGDQTAVGAAIEAFTVNAHR
jgi:hypothetical protein